MGILLALLSVLINCLFICVTFQVSHSVNKLLQIFSYLGEDLNNKKEYFLDKLTIKYHARRLIDFQRNKNL